MFVSKIYAFYQLVTILVKILFLVVIESDKITFVKSRRFLIDFSNFFLKPRVVFLKRTENQ